MEKVRLESNRSKFIWELPHNANVAGVDKEGGKFYAVRSYDCSGSFMLIMTDSLSPNSVNDLFTNMIFSNWISAYEHVGCYIKELYTFEDRKEMYKWLGED